MLDYYQENNITLKKEKVKTQLVLYIGDLPPDIDQYELSQFILSKGNFSIESMNIKKTKSNLSYAYVKFKTKRDVEEARKLIHLQSLNNYLIKAEPFKVEEKRAVIQEEGNIFFKGIGPKTTTKEVLDLFSRFGNIVSIKIKKDEFGDCLGFGYISYNDENSATEAIQRLNGFEFQGRSLLVEKFSKQTSKKFGNQSYPLVIVRDMPDFISGEEDLRNVFSKYGNINLCGVFKDEEFKNYGLVLFNTKEEAQRCIESSRDPEENNLNLVIRRAAVDKSTLDKLYSAKQQALKTKYQGCNIIVKNFPKDLTDKDLFNIFLKYGMIKSARLSTEGVLKEIRDNYGTVVDKQYVYESKGFGYVLYKDPSSARVAIDTIGDTPFIYNERSLNLKIEYFNYDKPRVKDNTKKEPSEVSP